MGIFDNILGGLKDVTNSEINRKINDTVGNIEQKVTDQIDTHVDAQVESIQNKVTNASIELVEKKFLLNMQKNYQEYG